MSECFLANYRRVLGSFLSLVASFYMISSLVADYLQEQPLGMVKYLVPAAVEEGVASGIEGIDCIYVINLENRPETYEKFQQDFRKHNLFVNRFNAINGWKLDFKWQDFFKDPFISVGDYRLVKKNKVQWTPGEIGCLLSHLSIIQDAYNRGFKRIWILEDDAKIIEDVQRLATILRRLTRIDPNWDIYYTDPNGVCFLYYDEAYLRPELRIPRIAQMESRRLIDFDIMTTGLRLGAYSYIISREGMEKVIHYFTHAPWYMPLDVEMHYIEGIREYSCPYYIVTVGMSNYTDTGARPKTVIGHGVE